MRHEIMDETDEQIDGFNTAAGLPPLRLFGNATDKTKVDAFQYRSRVTPFAAPPFRGYHVTRPQRVSKKHCSLTVFLLVPCYIDHNSTTKKDPKKMCSSYLMRELDHYLTR